MQTQKKYLIEGSSQCVTGQLFLNFHMESHFWVDFFDEKFKKINSLPRVELTIP